MKIEKINDNQIRCTLTQNDLATRKLKISELAYGSEKAKSLFRDMMEQASNECGFEADDIPLMIEAVPISSECIVLTITKVEDPEELDTRFSKFAPSVVNNTDDSADSMLDDVAELFQKIQKTDIPTIRVYQFTSLNCAIRLAHIVSELPIGRNSLYKDPKSASYYLLLYADTKHAECYNKLCNILSEYGYPIKNTPGMESYFQEHLEPICMDHALQSLSIV
ncbi:MAG: adaptor protein MecA [Lachnospiraceae bacterium]|nr:adaptor protein MecA [Lachnospiraceae bacterium]